MHRQPIQSKSKKWNGSGEISGRYFSSIRNKAKQRNLEFNVTVEQIWKLFLKQNRKCILSKLPLIIRKSINLDYFPGNASLDRIDSSKGYIIDNIQWIDKDINYMKSNLVEKTFLDFCKMVAENN